MSTVIDKDTFGKHIKKALQEGTGCRSDCRKICDNQSAWSNVGKISDTYDGNKRTTATMFLHFLDKNGVLFCDGRKLIDDHTLVALMIMIAESCPEERATVLFEIYNDDSE